MPRNETETGIILINRGGETEKDLLAFADFSTHRYNGESWSLFSISLRSTEGPCLIRFVPLFQGDVVVNRLIYSKSTNHESIPLAVKN